MGRGPTDSPESPNLAPGGGGVGPGQGAREALETESRRVQGPEEGGVSADKEKGKEKGKKDAPGSQK